MSNTNVSNLWYFYLILLNLVLFSEEPIIKLGMKIDPVSFFKRKNYAYCRFVTTLMHLL